MQTGRGFGAWLAARMRECGFRSNVELERAAGIGNTTISRWRNGTMAPSVDQLRKLSTPLQTPLLELLVRAGIVSGAEARVPREALSRPIEQDERDLLDLTVLSEETREHIRNQYELLRRVTPKEPSRKPLRAVARPRPPKRPNP